MKNLKLTKPIALLLSGLMITGSFAMTASAAEIDETSSGKTTSSSVVTQSIEEVKELMNTIKYAEYRDRHASASEGKSSVTVNGTDYVAEETDAEVKTDTYGGKSALYTPDEGSVSFKVDIPSDGLYVIEMEYYPIEGKASDIERSLRIDGVIPFRESNNLSMTKVWKNELPEATEEGPVFEKDPNGNDVRPTAYEAPTWQTFEFTDATGYYNEPFRYYLSAGEHTLTLEAIREAVAIGSITCKPADPIKTYEEYLAEHTSAGAVSSDATVKIQAEFPESFSSQTIYPTYDRSSAISEPQDPSKIRLNSIGKTTTWQSIGDWVEYTFTAKETGLHKIVTRFQQSEQSDMFVSRKITINGELPFAEAANLEFPYSDEFQVAALGDGENEFQFYFEKDQTYTIRIQVVLGHMAELISRIESTVTNLNNIYLKIKQITGATPDNYRDYNFIELIPDQLNLLIVESNNLYQFSEELEAITGERGSNCGTLNEIARIAGLMGRDEDEIARNLSRFKSNLGTLGTWMNTARNQPLQIDYISIQSPDAALPKANANFFQSIGYELSQFVASFYTDYNSLGSENSDGAETIDVWVTTGRDQSTIIRNMINDMFTPEYGVAVNLKLVAAGTLLPATLAGEGPDVAYMGGSDPVNYAIRSAVQKLDDFDTFDEVCARFNPEAVVPFTLSVDDNPETPDVDEAEKSGTYAIPETQSFSMLFYRTDIFAELDLEVPRTWDELKAILPVLQSQYMEIAMPQSLAGFTLLYYQREGDLYADNGMRINLDSNLALDTFKELCDMFTQYKFPLTFDFSNRFRSGEMPLGIQDYSLYTQLNAFATEIKGQWAMTTLPGYEVTDENGNTYINNTSTTSVSGLVMMRDDERSESESAAAWKYIDWITSKSAQATYGNEYSALLGNGTIHPTANVEALNDMNWSKSELEVLQAQFTNLRSTPEYPGSYIVTRYVEFAFLDAYNNNADPVDSLLSEYIYINKEISRKRQEFGLETLELGQTLEEKRAATDGTTDAAE